MENHSSPARVRVWRIVFRCLAWAMVACVVLQTLLAGAAVFSDPARWKDHTSFVHLFEFLPLLMLICAFPARLSTAARWQTGALFALIFAQYATANAPGAGMLHPVVALMLFALSLHVARKGRGRVG